MCPHVMLCLQNNIIIHKFVSGPETQIEGRCMTGVCGKGLSYVFAAPPIKYLVIFLTLSIANPNPNPNLKP